jgi:DNA-binding MarR family transcriptional regulator
MTPDLRAQHRAQAAKVGATCACFNIRKVARAVTQLYDDVLRPTGLRTTQLSLLTLLRGHGQLTINRLAEASATDRTTLTRNLAVLEARRLVRIRAGNDARVRVVELTDAGHKAVDAAYPLWQKAQARMTKRMGEEGLARLLTDLSAAMKAAAAESAA